MKQCGKGPWSRKKAMTLIRIENVFQKSTTSSTLTNTIDDGDDEDETWVRFLSLRRELPSQKNNMISSAYEMNLERNYEIS